MRTLSSAVLSTIAEQLGTEPVNIIEVQWVQNGNWLIYGDKKLDKYEFRVDGKIQDIGVLESVIKLDSQGVSNGIEIILSDHEGDIKNIIDNHDIHDRTVRIYQWFEGLPLSERFLLYEGQITSPISWSEGDRSLKFSAITQLANKEAGFSPEEGNFPFLPESMVGKAWPLVFGSVQNVPCVRLFDVPTTQAVESVSASDPSIYTQLSKLTQQRQDLLNAYNYYILALLQASFTCEYGDTLAQRQSACSVADQLTSSIAQISQQLNQLEAERQNLQAQLDNQQDYEKTTLAVANGSSFPQGETVTIQIGGLLLSGVFSGNTFHISNRTIIDYSYNEGEAPYGFTFVQAGSTVAIKTEAPLVYIVSITPCEVHTVQAYRRTESDDILTIIPRNWYTIETVDIGSYTVTYIKITVPLSSRDATLQDDLYVTCTSDIGPNTVDIMKWLIDTYTDLTYDTTSFNSVSAKIDNYPSHFALLERKNVITLLEEIAFQARCAIWVSNNVFYLKYLSEEQTADDTINESDIDAGSLELFTTSTEEIVTKLTAVWTDNYALSEDHKLILRHNIEKYGTREREIDFYIYNIGELVLKSATFWMIRLSNMWKNLRFKTYLHKLALETFDVVNFNFTQEFIANSDIKGVLTNVTYDSDNKLLSMEAWLPVKFGTMEKYVFTWPKDIDVTYLFPTQEEIAQGYAGGNGPGSETEGGFILSETEKSYVGYTSISNYSERGMRDQRLDYGDEKPTDVDDTKPEPRFSGIEFVVDEEPSYDYGYGDYTPTIEVASVAASEFSSVYPGIVVSGSEDLYEVDVYQEGLTAEPIRATVKQLQIDTTATIPVGTWLLVAVNKLEDDSYEYTMQVPVWL